MIELRHLKKTYESATPLEDVSAMIRNGDVISVIGPSGTGKSTLLRCINLLERPTAGDVVVDGETVTAPGYDVTKVRRKVGMVFQSFNLFNDLTVLENVVTPQVEVLGRSPREARDRAVKHLSDVGMKGFLDSYPQELSGGQKQRAAIARTLAMDPEVILFDEPTSALDPAMVREVELVIEDLAKSGITMLIVTHEMSFAEQISNRVFFMDLGGIYADGTPEEIFRSPKDERIRRFLKAFDILKIRIDSPGYDFMDAAAKIDNYSAKYRLSPKRAHDLRGAYEELCQGILYGRLGADALIETQIEYSPESDELTLDVRYNGESFDPEDTDDEISLRLLRGRISSMAHESIREGEFTNLERVRM